MLDLVSREHSRQLVVEAYNLHGRYDLSFSGRVTLAFIQIHSCLGGAIMVPYS